MDAIIYIRWSSLEQTKGDSYTRQINACTKFCADNGYNVIDTVIDKGRSAYTGENIHTGNLGKLVQRYERREIAPGTPIIVEQLDRLTRLPAMEVIAWLAAVFPHGVRFLTADKSHDISKQAMERDNMSFVALIFDSFRGNAESKRKADMGALSWQSRRNAVASGQRKNITGVCPAWLRWNKIDERFEVVEGRGEVLQRIFDMSDAGLGVGTIAKTLNEEGVEPWGLGAKRSPDGWHISYVQKILRNPSVIGEFTPRSRKKIDMKGKIVGDPIPDYYPQVISPAQFERVSAKRTSINTGGARKNRQNLTGGLVWCGRCGQRMNWLKKSAAGRQRANPKTGTVTTDPTASIYLKCSGALRGNRCDQKSGYNYRWFEKGLLDNMLHLALDDQHFAHGEIVADKQDKLAAARREFNNLEAQADSALEMTLDPAFKDDERLKRRYAELGHQADEQRKLLAKLEDELAAAKGRVAPAAHVARVEEVRKAIDSEDDLVRDAARGKVIDALQALVARITFRADRTIEVAAAHGAMGIQLDDKGNLLQSIDLYNRLDLRRGIERMDNVGRPDFKADVEAVQKRRTKA